MRPESKCSLASAHGPLTRRMPSLRTTILAWRAAGQANRPTTGRRRGGRVSAAAWATRTGSDLTLAATTRETTTGCLANPFRNPLNPARADFAETLEESGVLASDTTR